MFLYFCIFLGLNSNEESYNIHSILVPKCLYLTTLITHRSSKLQGLLEQANIHPLISKKMRKRSQDRGSEL